MASHGRFLLKNFNSCDFLCRKITEKLQLRILRRRLHSKTRTRKNDFGFLFDIDGVIVRGKKILPTAREAFQLLTDENGKFKIPVVFVTNAGNAFRHTKAEQLSEWLDVKVDTEQVVMSHSPLKMFKQFHNMHALICGQGPIEAIARDLGFTNIITVDQLRDLFPKLDMVDHSHRKIEPCPIKMAGFKPIETVILFGEPTQWESKLQLIVDVLVCNGRPAEPMTECPSQHLPVLACNMDLLWMAEANKPRFGHGMFLTLLETAYQKYTGRELKYTALLGKPSLVTYHYADNILWQQAQKLGFRRLRSLYCIGDNPYTDIYGANCYDQFLMKHRMQRQVVKKRVATGGGGSDLEVEDEEDMYIEEQHYAKSCNSILVCTGIHTNSHEQSHHNHRDFVLDPELNQPKQVTENVLEAVKLVLNKEKFI